MILQLLLAMLASWSHRHHQHVITYLYGLYEENRFLLRHHHMEPAPTRRQTGMSWSQFLKRHWEVLAATDFFTVEVATWRGLVTYYGLVVMELRTRYVHVAGITPHPP
jgi:hypothetical protein